MAYDKKSYNFLALKGAEVDDMELVERNGWDPAVAYTPKINEMMLDQVHKENTDWYLEKGIRQDDGSYRPTSEKEAKAKADANRAGAARDLKELMAKRGMLK